MLRAMTTPASEPQPATAPATAVAAPGPAPAAPSPAAEPAAVVVNTDPTVPLDYDGPAMVVNSEPASPAEPIEPEEPQGWQHPDPEKWEHEWLDFHGDRLAFRVPSQSALSGYQLAAGPGSTAFDQSRYTRRLLERHLSAPSFDRVFDRVMDPDDTAYSEGEDVLGQLIQGMTKPLVDRLTAEAEAAKAAAKKRG